MKGGFGSVERGQELNACLGCTVDNFRDALALSLSEHNVRVRETASPLLRPVMPASPPNTHTYLCQCSIPRPSTPLELNGFWFKILVPYYLGIRSIQHTLV